MNISARVSSAAGQHCAIVQTEQDERPVAIPPKAAGPGSSVNGGELLFLALATCFCNDVYREAVKFGITVDGVDVSVTGDFDGEGVAQNVRYGVKLKSNAPREAVTRLVRHVDAIAEIHRALRSGTAVELDDFEIVALCHPE